MTKLRILVVEDSETHLQSAICVLEESGIDVVVARDECQGRERMVHTGAEKVVPAVDGVITDLFMPHSAHLPGDSGRQACGIAVALEAQHSGIPFVICTAGYHHGPRYEWICALGRRLGWPEMVDCYNPNNPNAEAQRKDWGLALQRLIALIEKKT